MRDGIAQHVLEGRHHALEHLAIELARSAFDREIRLLAGVRRGLPHDARETLHVALERHHARAHESVLQLVDRARLLREQVLRVLGQVLEQLLNAADVVRRFGETAGELLDRGITVHFERIEIALLSALFLVAMQDLRFRLELELAQLFLETRDRARQLAHVEVDRADLLLEARTRDARFAGIVEQLVEELRIDARELRAIGGRRGLPPGGHRSWRQQRRIGVAVLRIFVETRRHGFFQRRAHHDGWRLGGCRLHGDAGFRSKRRCPHGREHRRIGMQLGQQRLGLGHGRNARHRRNWLWRRRWRCGCERDRRGFRLGHDGRRNSRKRRSGRRS